MSPIEDDLVVDDRALAFELLRRDDVGHVARDVEDVVAEAADDARRHAERRALDHEVVVAFQAVDFDHFDVGVGDVEAGAEDALVGDDEVVGELGAEHQHLVEAGAAVDRDRRVDVVFDLVVAGTAVQQFGRLRSSCRRGLDDRHAVAVGLDRAVGVGLGEREGAHDEQVVAVVALEPQRGLVAVDLEHIVAGAAFGDQRGAGAAAEIAARRRDRSPKTSVGAMLATMLRCEPKIWPIWKLSSPAPPSSVVIALLSSTAK